MRHVSIAEIMQETGLSRATVDRVLNGRGNVHARTRKAVEDTLRRMQTPIPPYAKNRPPTDILLRVGRGMMSQLRNVWLAHASPDSFHDLYQAQEGAIVETAARLCEDTARPLFITAMNTGRLLDVLKAARRRGKKIVTLISDLDPDARDFYVGIDDRAAGQTAAFLIGRALGSQPAAVGVVVGNIAFRCHEDREIAFRTGLRAQFPKIIVAGEAHGEDDVELTRAAVLRMIEQQPALAAIYNVGGGNFGVVKALQEAGRADDMLLVGHEVNMVTTPLLRQSALHFAIAGDPGRLIDKAFTFLEQAQIEPGKDKTILDFGVYTRFNLPAFAPVDQTVPPREPDDRHISDLF